MPRAQQEPTNRDREPAEPPPIEEERRLVEAALAGDRAAAERLAATSYAQVFASLVKMTGDRDLAADLTQETYRKAWRSLQSFDRRARFATWLYRIAYNTFLNHVRRPRPVEPIDEVPEGRTVDDGPGPEDRLDRREVAERLRRAVLGLPEDLRFTVTARFWADAPVKEIAAAEDVTGAAIRKRLKNAMARLRLALEEEAA